MYRHKPLSLYLQLQITILIFVSALVQILKMEVVMDKVIDRVVETHLKIYNAICYRVWKLCFLGNRQPSLQVLICVLG